MSQEAKSRNVKISDQDKESFLSTLFKLSAPSDRAYHESIKNSSSFDQLKESVLAYADHYFLTELLAGLKSEWIMDDRIIGSDSLLPDNLIERAHNRLPDCFRLKKDPEDEIGGYERLMQAVHNRKNALLNPTADYAEALKRVQSITDLSEKNRLLLQMLFGRAQILNEKLALDFANNVFGTNFAVSNFSTNDFINLILENLELTRGGVNNGNEFEAAVLNHAMSLNKQLREKNLNQKLLGKETFKVERNPVDEKTYSNKIIIHYPGLTAAEMNEIAKVYTAYYPDTSAAVYSKERGKDVYLSFDTKGFCQTVLPVMAEVIQQPQSAFVSDQPIISVGGMR